MRDKKKSMEGQRTRPFLAQRGNPGLKDSRRACVPAGPELRGEEPRRFPRSGIKEALSGATWVVPRIFPSHGGRESLFFWPDEACMFCPPLPPLVPGLGTGSQRRWTAGTNFPARGFISGMTELPSSRKSTGFRPGTEKGESRGSSFGKCFGKDRFIEKIHCR